MIRRSIPVDVICVCSSDGEIRPLRFRVPAEDKSLLRIDVEQIISTKRIQYTGIEAQVYSCRALLGDEVWMFDLKYLIRAHQWYLFPESG